MIPRIRIFLAGLQPLPAIDAMRKLLICFGAIYIVTFVITLHFYLWIPAALAICGCWYILYLMEIHPRRDYMQRVIENSQAFRRLHGDS